MPRGRPGMALVDWPACGTGTAAAVHGVVLQVPCAPHPLMLWLLCLQAAIKQAIKRASTLGAKIAPVAAARVAGEEGGAAAALTSEDAAPKRRRRSEKDDDDENAEVGGWAAVVT